LSPTYNVLILLSLRLIAGPGAKRPGMNYYKCRERSRKPYDFSVGCDFWEPAPKFGPNDIAQFDDLTQIDNLSQIDDLTQIDNLSQIDDSTQNDDSNQIDKSSQNNNSTKIDNLSKSDCTNYLSGI